MILLYVPNFEYLLLIYIIIFPLNFNYRINNSIVRNELCLNIPAVQFVSFLSVSDHTQFQLTLLFTCIILFNEQFLGAVLDNQ